MVAGWVLPICSDFCILFQPCSMVKLLHFSIVKTFAYHKIYDTSIDKVFGGSEMAIPANGLVLLTCYKAFL